MLTEVEGRLIDGQRYGQIVLEVSEKFGMSPRTVKRDIRRVLTRWRQDDMTGSSQIRERIVAGLLRNARECYASGDLAGERDAHAKAGRLLGMGVGLRFSPFRWLFGEFYWGGRLVGVSDPGHTVQDDGIYLRVQIDVP